jgi:hypothetical protein
MRFGSSRSRAAHEHRWTPIIRIDGGVLNIDSPSRLRDKRYSIDVGPTFQSDARRRRRRHDKLIERFVLFPNMPDVVNRNCDTSAVRLTFKEVRAIQQRCNNRRRKRGNEPEAENIDPRLAQERPSFMRFFLASSEPQARRKYRRGQCCGDNLVEPVMEIVVVYQGHRDIPDLATGYVAQSNWLTRRSIVLAVSRGLLPVALILLNSEPPERATPWAINHSVASQCSVKQCHFAAAAFRSSVRSACDAALSSSAPLEKLTRRPCWKSIGRMSPAAPFHSSRKYLRLRSTPSELARNVADRLSTLVDDNQPLSSLPDPRILRVFRRA